MLTLMSGVFSLVMLMLCLCASENQPLAITSKRIPNYFCSDKLSLTKWLKETYGFAYARFENVSKHAGVTMVTVLLAQILFFAFVYKNYRHQLCKPTPSNCSS